MIIAGFKEDSFVDWRGKMVATVFTYGCNFRCPFCHNFYLVTEKPQRVYEEDEIIRRIKSLRGWIDGVCITGGEPTLHRDIVKLVEKIREIAPVKIDTNGTNPDVLEELLDIVDYVAMDIKAPRHRYPELAGVNVDLGAIDESIRQIMKKAGDYEFRTTFVPILSPNDIHEIASWISGAKRYVIQQFSTSGGTLDPEFSKLKPLKNSVLEEACRSASGHVGECIIANL